MNLCLTKKTLTKALCQVAITLLLLCAGGRDSTAATFSFLGAETLEPGQSTVYGTVGVPEIEVGAGFGLNSLVDVTPRLRLQFGRGMRIGGLGLSAGVAARMKVARTHGWTIALVAEPELGYHVGGKDHPPVASDATQDNKTFSASLLAGGVVADRMLVPGTRLLAGIKAPLTFHLAPTTVMNVPLLLELGMEVEVGQQLFLLARFDGGFDFYGPGGTPGRRPHVRVRVGLGWLR